MLPKADCTGEGVPLLETLKKKQTFALGTTVAQSHQQYVEGHTRAAARGHDDAIWTTLRNMLAGTGDADAAPARHVAAPYVQLLKSEARAGAL